MNKNFSKTKIPDLELNTVQYNKQKEWKQKFLLSTLNSEMEWIKIILLSKNL